MRIIAGTLGGRRISAPRGDETRPTTDRVRESMFAALSSRLGADIGGGPVLDAFAGSGALGLEALSRGATPVTFVEHHRAALATLRANISSLGVANSTRVIADDTFKLARRGAITGGPFALLLLDPPYRIASVEVRGLLGELEGYSSLADDATVVWEHASATEAEFPSGFEIVSDKRYGDTAVTIAVRKRGEA